MYLSVLFANAVIDFPDGRVWLWSGAAHHGPNLIQAEEKGFQGFPGFPGFPGGYKVFQVAPKFMGLCLTWQPGCSLPPLLHLRQLLASWTWLRCHPPMSIICDQYKYHRRVEKGFFFFRNSMNLGNFFLYCLWWESRACVLCQVTSATVDMIHLIKNIFFFSPRLIDEKYLQTIYEFKADIQTMSIINIILFIQNKLSYMLQ